MVCGTQNKFAVLVGYSQLGSKGAVVISEHVASPPGRTSSLTRIGLVSRAVDPVKNKFAWNDQE